MQQYQVPQFIDVEDKIFSFITLRQFLIMLIPLGVFILFYFISKIWLAIIITLPVLVVSAVFAFVKPNGMRFSRFFKAFLDYNLKPRLYVWKQEANEVTIDELEEQQPIIKPKNTLNNKKSKLETGFSSYEESSENEDEFDELDHAFPKESDYLNEVLEE